MTNTSPPYSSKENPLWQFSLDFYGFRGVEQFLLECQDNNGADVCLMLWASYTAVCGRAVSEEGWRVADRGVAPRRRIISSVRGLRRWLGRLRPHTQSVYALCQRYELKLEQLQLAALWKMDVQDCSGDCSALELAARQYGLPQKDQARWAGLIESYLAHSGLATRA
ncbi:TIGR02444 family protein [Microbulbifer sp. SSSA002]|uniref:TIGR02444 family protein n=1 Tax=Microbulbifer sp. SSSA002 TaxID=3243376 RepID=UPI00403A253E